MIRSACLATAVALGSLFSLVASGQAQCPGNLSITNYRFVSEQRVSLTLSNVTYTADLVNPGRRLLLSAPR